MFKFLHLLEDNHITGLIQYLVLWTDLKIAEKAFCRSEFRQHGTVF